MTPLRSLLLAVLMLSACAPAPEPFSIGGQPVEVAAAQQIEGQIADDFGMPLVADCPVVPEPAVGTEFACVATTSSGQFIDFAGTVQSPDRLELSSTNVVSSMAVDEVRAQLATDLTQSTGLDITVECPSEMITMEQPIITCIAATDSQPETNPITLTFTNARSGSYRVDLTEFTLFDARADALNLITGDLAAIVGVDLVPSCPDQIDAIVGTQFRCTGEMADGRVVEFLGNVDRVRHIDMQTTNFLREEVVQAFEVAAAEALAPQTLVDTTIDCQPRPVLFNDRGEIRCALVLGNADQARTALIQIEDFSTLQFTVSVETPGEAAAETTESTQTESTDETGGA